MGKKLWVSKIIVLRNILLKRPILAIFDVRKEAVGSNVDSIQRFWQ